MELWRFYSCIFFLITIFIQITNGSTVYRAGYNALKYGRYLNPMKIASKLNMDTAAAALMNSFIPGSGTALMTASKAADNIFMKLSPPKPRTNELNPAQQSLQTGSPLSYLLPQETGNIQQKIQPQQEMNSFQQTKQEMDSLHLKGHTQHVSSNAQHPPDISQAHHIPTNMPKSQFITNTPHFGSEREYLEGTNINTKTSPTPTTLELASHHQEPIFIQPAAHSLATGQSQPQSQSQSQSLSTFESMPSLSVREIGSIMVPTHSSPMTPIQSSAPAPVAMPTPAYAPDASIPLKAPSS